MEEHYNGKWVKWEDYARLKAEVEKWEKNTQLMGRQLNDELEQVARLKAEVERWKFTLEEERQIMREDWAGLRCEKDRVQRALEYAEAQVERLTKAGDAMHCFLIGYIVENRLSSAHLNKLDDDWSNAAKGVQS
jgi:chromosome segregation ATPase